MVHQCMSEDKWFTTTFGIHVGAPALPARGRAWIMVRRVAHTTHHRAEPTTWLQLLGRSVQGVYGLAIDTSGLPANRAATIYAFPDVAVLVDAESPGRAKAPLPRPGPIPSTEGPDQ